MIKAENIVKSYSEDPVLRGVDLELREGSIYGLIGPNGAGKTSLIKVLCGIYVPEQGTVTLEGEEVCLSEKARGRIGYVPDSILFYNHLTVADMKEFYKGSYRSWNEERYRLLREVFTFPEKKRIKHLSKGMKTQLSMLMTLSCMPEVILMDEPTSGLDPFVRREVLNLIVQDVSTRGSSVLISTHNILELEQICDRVGFIDKGKMILQENMEELKFTYKKVQIAFEGEMPEEFKREFSIVSMKQYGKVYELIIDEQFEIFKMRAEPYRPILVEKLDMTLEEIFLHRMGGEGYAVKDITI